MIYIVFHTESGWSTEQFATEYLHYIKDTYLKEDDGCLIWDLHSSHRTASVREEASSLGIGILFIPAGQTDHWQPLDKRVFGALKAKAREEFDKMMADKELRDVSIMDAIDILVKCWKVLDVDLVKKSWSHIAHI